MEERSKLPSENRLTMPGIYDRPAPITLGTVEVVCIVLSALWLVGAGLVFVLTRGNSESGLDTLRFLMTLLVVFLPVCMMWVAAVAARTGRTMRAESRRLETAIDAIRQAYLTQSQTLSGGSESSVTRKLEEIAAATRKTEATLATFSTRRDPESLRRMQTAAPAAAAGAATAQEQPGLALEQQPTDTAAPLSTEDFIRALNFPETAEDEIGFAALRRALKVRGPAQLIQAAQDILTLLSQEGIYMDDLRPDRARPEVWRQFGQGARGRTIAPLGGIRDRSSLALTAARMKKDSIFRDAAHHFLRRFDKAFAEFEATASDGEISALADTRTARAFMLLGRVAGTFD